MGRVHTPMAQAAHRPRAHCSQASRTGRVVTHTRACRGTHRRRIEVMPGHVAGHVLLCHRMHATVSRAPFGYDTKTVSQQNSCRTPCRSAPAPCRRALLRRIAACIATHIETQRPPLATIQTIVCEGPTPGPTRRWAPLTHWTIGASPNCPFLSPP